MASGASAGALVLVAGLLGGCTTTQQAAARLRLNSARIVLAQNATRVTTSGRAVVVTGVDAVRAAGASAAVVALTNTGSQALSDLPISVGYTLGRRRVYLNAAAGLTYFDAHLPLIGAHQQIRWVYTSPQRIPAGARLFARVGARPAVAVGEITSTPNLSAEALAGSGRATGSANSTLKVRIDNRSGVPQYQLQVYAVGLRGTRVVSAGNITVPYIGSSSIQTVEIHPAGAVIGSDVELEALPTTYH